MFGVLTHPAQQPAQHTCQHFATKLATEDLTSENLRVPIAFSYLGKAAHQQFGTFWYLSFAKDS